MNSVMESNYCPLQSMSRTVHWITKEMRQGEFNSEINRPDMCRNPRDNQSIRVNKASRRGNLMIPQISLWWGSTASIALRSAKTKTNHHICIPVHKPILISTMQAQPSSFSTGLIDFFPYILDTADSTDNGLSQCKSYTLQVTDFKSLQPHCCGQCLNGCISV